MRAGFKPAPGAHAKLKHALREYADLVDKNNPEGMQELVLQSARRFVKNAAAITAPAQGTLDTAAKKKGEDAVLADVMKLAIPVQVVGATKAQAAEILARAEDVLAAHSRSRSGSSGGRVNPRSRKEKLMVAQADFNRVVRELQGRVGFLAAGLNAAAARLGFQLPSWVRRHGAKFGKIEVTIGKTHVKVRVVQNTPYTGGVKGYARKWEWAFAKELRTVQKMMGVMREKTGNKARRRLR